MLQNHLISFPEIVEGEVHQIQVHRGNIIADDEDHPKENAIALDRVYSQTPDNCFVLSHSGQHEVSLEIPWALVTHVKVQTTATEASECKYEIWKMFGQLVRNSFKM